MSNNIIESSREDIVQVGLPEDADKKLKHIIDITKYFKDQQDVYKVAVGVALAKNMCDSGWKNRSLERLGTKFSVSGLDSDGSMKKIILLLAPDAGNTPYKYSQWLATAGINYLHKELVDNSRSIVDVLQIEDKENIS